MMLTELPSSSAGPSLPGPNDRAARTCALAASTLLPLKRPAQAASADQPLVKRVHNPPGDAAGTRREEAAAGSSEQGAHHGIAFSCVSVKNQRAQQEDTYQVAHLALGQGALLASVCDGHGNAEVAKFLQANMAQAVQQQLQGSAGPASALVSAFAALDRHITQNSSQFAEGGSTACVALVTEEEVLCANCGDSRAVVSRGGEAVALSEDHKPERDDEADRVTKAGGVILFNNGLRVMGVLGMTRAMGDVFLKRYGVSAEPEVTRTKREAEDEFMLVASDGLWGSISNKEAVDVARMALAKAQSKGFSRPSAACIAAKVLIRAAVARGSRDNITVVVVDLRREQAQPQLQLTGAAADLALALRRSSLCEQEAAVLSSACKAPAAHAGAQPEQDQLGTHPEQQLHNLRSISMPAQHSAGQAEGGPAAFLHSQQPLGAAEAHSEGPPSRTSCLRHSTGSTLDRADEEAAALRSHSSSSRMLFRAISDQSREAACGREHLQQEKQAAAAAPAHGAGGAAAHPSLQSAERLLVTVVLEGA